MLEAECINKFRNSKNQIMAYRLMDMFGRIQDIYTDELKSKIKNGDISIINLTLTSDNRLIDKVILNRKRKRIWRINL